jgi:hypothetical protein
MALSVLALHAIIPNVFRYSQSCFEASYVTGTGTLPTYERLLGGDILFQMTSMKFKKLNSAPARRERLSHKKSRVSCLEYPKSISMKA